MLSDPEVESAVLISSDEGASFEKHPINFNILSLLFHPAQENWILAYSHDNKVASEWIHNEDNIWYEMKPVLFFILFIIMYYLFLWFCCGCDDGCAAH